MLLLNTNYVNTDVIQKVPYSDQLQFFAINTVNSSIQRIDPITNLATNVYPGRRFNSYYDDTFANRIIIVESSYTLGEITEDYQLTIEIYNNTGSAKTIGDVNFVNISGIDYELTDTVIKDSNSVLLKLTILKSGEADNNGYVELVINGVSYQIKMVFSRSNIFDFFVNRNQPLIVTYSYLTEIMQSLNLKETRVSYLDRPRMAFQYNYLIEDNDRRTFENAIVNADTSNTYVPLLWESFLAEFKNNNRIYFTDISTLNLTVNDYILIENYDYTYKKAYRISAIDNSAKFIQIATDFDVNLNNNFVVVKPLVRAKLINTVNATRIMSNLYSYTLTFNIDSFDNDKDFLQDQSSFNYQTINGIEYYPEFISNSEDQTTKTFDKSITVLDNQISVKKNFAYNTTSQVTESFGYLLDGKKEISLLKNIFRRNYGKLGSFYKIKADDDMTVISPISINSSSIIVKDNNLRQSFANGFFDSILVVYNNDTFKTFLVSDVRKSLAGEEIILSTPISQDIDITKINLVTMVNIVRFDNDALTLTYISDNLASSALTFKQVVVK